eukprot:gene13434-28483_t
MPYSFYCILPHDRFVSIYNEVVIKNEISEVCNPSECTANIGFYSINNTCRIISLSELGDKLGFIYSPYLSFLHEYDLRHCLLLGIDSSGCSSTASDLDIITKLETGFIHPSVIVRHIGLCGDIDVGYGLFSSSPITSQSMIGEYTGIVSSVTQDSCSYSVNYPCGDSVMGLSASEQGNVIRLVNHCSVDPNCEFRHISHEKMLHVVC